eukprot:Skav227908  [mRNA]  locus=scaffold146:80936:90778:+ [translate_table: standard]
MSAWSALVSCLAIAMAQQPGTLKTEGNLTISVKECDANECTTKSHKLFLDANWRWIRTEDFENCHAGNAWDDSICADATTCAQKWQAEAVDAEGYEKTYGITAVPGGVQLNLVTKDGENRNLASRLFLLEDDDNYKLFDLNNCEFALDVDSSTVQCGMNGAMCFVEMAANGGLDLGANKAGAKFGTGYCDAQRPYDETWYNHTTSWLDRAGKLALIRSKHVRFYKTDDFCKAIEKQGYVYAPDVFGDVLMLARITLIPGHHASAATDKGTKARLFSKVSPDEYIYLVDIELSDLLRR